MMRFVGDMISKEPQLLNGVVQQLYKVALGKTHTLTQYRNMHYPSSIAHFCLL